MKRCIYFVFLFLSYQIFSIFNSCKIFNIYLNIAAEKPFSGSAIKVYVCMYVTLFVRKERERKEPRSLKKAKCLCFRDSYNVGTKYKTSPC